MVLMLFVTQVADLGSDSLDSLVLDAVAAEDHTALAAVMTTLEQRKVILTLETTLGLAVWHPVLFLETHPEGLSYLLLLTLSLS